MRTTVTLDPDVEQLVKTLMREKDIGFKQALNQAVRLGLSRGNGRDDFRTPVFDMGFDTTVAYDHSLRLAGELEDDELARKIQTRR